MAEYAAVSPVRDAVVLTAILFITRKRFLYDRLYF